MRHADVAQVVEHGTVYVLNLGHLATQQSPYIFDGSSAQIWLRIDGATPTTRIVNDLAEIYGAPAVTIDADVRAFIEYSVAMGLVHLDPADE